MKNIFLTFCVVLICLSNGAFGQIPVAVHVRILKAEDERRFDRTLETLLASPDADTRARAALAAGRIGNERAVPALVKLLEDAAPEVRAQAAFALGEIESADAAVEISEIINVRKSDARTYALALEAAGKIGAANRTMAQAVALGRAVVEALEREAARGTAANREAVLLGITAILRLAPENGAATAAKFLSSADSRIRADALNTLARLRAKNVSAQARELLVRDLDPIVRANAARVLAAAEDKDSFDLLLNAATKDVDSRARVAAIRALAGAKDKNYADALTLYGENLLRAAAKNSGAKSELLEIAATLSRILPNTNDQKAVAFLVALNEWDKYQSPETESALARIAPSRYGELQRSKKDFLKNDWRALNATLAGIGELAKAPEAAGITEQKNFARAQALVLIRTELLADRPESMILADAVAAYAAFKPADLADVLRDALEHKDAVARASVAGLLAETAVSKETIEALKQAFTKSLLTDKRENDAQLAILDALYKLDKKEAVGSLLLARTAPDYLVRRKAIELLETGDFAKDFPGIPAMLESAKRSVEPYQSFTGTRLGQILNTEADYRRALARKNGAVKAVFTTTKGAFTIDLLPEDAPLTVDNFIKLARAGYFNGLTVHRVVANFVMQDGDPRGDGSGGPGWQIRCEINQVPYERGAVGMALSGKDTGGSQWFATHSPQPHLDGGYTVFGRVNETGMKIVDRIVRGDKITSVRILESAPPRKR